MASRSDPDWWAEAGLDPTAHARWRGGMKLRRTRVGQIIIKDHDGAVLGRFWSKAAAEMALATMQPFAYLKLLR